MTISLRFDLCRRNERILPSSGLLLLNVGGTRNEEAETKKKGPVRKRIAPAPILPSPPDDLVEACLANVCVG